MAQRCARPSSFCFARRRRHTRYKVTGVQTCALPIAIERLFLPNGYWRDFVALHWDLRTFAGQSNIAKAWGAALKNRRVSAIRLEVDSVAAFERKIGRASCRERV